ARKFNGDIIVRITSDCPLIDPDLIDRGLNIFLNGDYDYVSNGFPPTYPDGFDTEVFSYETLETAWKEARLPSEREHVTPYIWKNKDKFNQINFENDTDLSNFRLTVDTKEDFILIAKIIENFHDKWNSFRLKDVINFLKENTELLKINAQYQRNEGYLKSLKKDNSIQMS
ncbi:MAG: cytidylyltransferase domain-containing protein, partial [Candidatus Odinarchaeota archaeon]